MTAAVGVVATANDAVDTSDTVDMGDTSDTSDMDDRTDFGESGVVVSTGRRFLVRPGTTTVGQASATVDRANEINIRDGRCASVDSAGNITVTAGRRANNRGSDKFVIKEGGSTADGLRTAEIWVNNQLAATIRSAGSRLTTITVKGSRDVDRIDASGAPEFVRIAAYGSSGNDSIIGSKNSDTVYGESGDDRIYARDGNDVIYGGNGNDLLRGENGHDLIYGENGNDTLYGDEGNDSLRGQAGNDFLDGGPGFDDLDESAIPQPDGPANLQATASRFTTLMRGVDGRESYRLYISWEGCSSHSSSSIGIGKSVCFVPV